MERGPDFYGEADERNTAGKEHDGGRGEGTQKATTKSVL